MKNILLATSLLLSVTGVHGAVQYEFRQTFHSDVEALPSNNMTGRGIIDGDRYRVEFLSGTAFPAGSYLISNATKQQIWVDPSKKSYVEVNAASVASALGASHITISNKKIDVTQMPDHPILAGLPTDHTPFSAFIRTPRCPRTGMSLAVSLTACACGATMRNVTLPSAASSGEVTVGPR